MEHHGATPSKGFDEANGIVLFKEVGQMGLKGLTPIPTLTGVAHRRN